MKSKVFQEEVKKIHLDKKTGMKRWSSERRDYIPEFKPLDNSILREFLAMDWKEVDPKIDLHSTPHHLYQDAAERWINFGEPFKVEEKHLPNINLWKNFLIETGKLKAN